jgi:hypothetical protein
MSRKLDIFLFNVQQSHFARKVLVSYEYLRQSGQNIENLYHQITLALEEQTQVL